MIAQGLLTALPPGRRSPGRRLLALDGHLFRFAAERHWPAGERVLPRLSRSANHGGLWFAAAAVLAASGTPRGRRAAAHGLASLGLASLTVNTLGKRSVRRARPVPDMVPRGRRLKRQPLTTSFPSGHSASAAAFAAGVALESPAWGAVVGPLAFSVAMSRVYTGVHFPGDVLAGAALGVGAALVVRHAPRPRRRSGAPAAPDDPSVRDAIQTVSPSDRRRTV